MRNPEAKRGEISPPSSLDLSVIDKLMEISSQYGLEELELKHGDVRICVKSLLISPLPLKPRMPRWEEIVTPPPKEEREEKEEGDNDLVEVTAPMTGVFHRSPAPGAPPYVKEEDLVEEGQTLCLIEAMKVFNEVSSPARGRMEKILVGDKTLVRQGEKIMFIRPAAS